MLPTDCLNAIDLKAALLELLGEYIGTITYNSGGTEVYEPAIHIGNPRNDLTVCGIEITITSAPRIVDQYHVCKQVFSKLCWEIRISQRELDSKGYVMPLLIERLSQYLHEASVIPMMTKNILGDYDKFLITWYFYRCVDALSSTDIANLTPWVADPS